MKRSCILFCLLTFNLLALEDLGIYGSTHSIKEKNFIEDINERAKDLNTTALQDQLTQSGSDYLKAKTIVPLCKETLVRTFEPTFIVPADVKLPNGKVIAKAGDKLNTLEVMKKRGLRIDRYVMFIDVSDETQIQLSNLYKNQGLVFVVNGDIDYYEKKTKTQTFKADKSSIERFGINCTPTIIRQENNNLVVYEYNINDIKKKEQ